MNSGTYTIESVHGLKETVVLSNFQTSNHFYVGPQTSAEPSDNELREIELSDNQPKAKSQNSNDSKEASRS